MDKLSFNDTINFIKVKIEDYGVSHIGAEVFIGQKSKCVSQWLSIAGNDFVLKPVLGVCSKKLDKIVGAALKKVVPTFVVGRVSVPIFRVPAERISTKDLRIIQGRTNGPGYDMKEILEFLEWLRKFGLPFLAEHSNFEAALDMALRWNKYDQAQQYYIPALMLMLQMKQEKSKYVSEIVNMMSSQDEGMSKMYGEYFDKIDVFLENNFKRQR